MVGLATVKPLPQNDVITYTKRFRRYLDLIPHQVVYPRLARDLYVAELRIISEHMGFDYSRITC
jgi:hypothetical protein